MATVTNVKRFVRSRYVVIFAASAASAVGGAFGGYKYANRLLAKKYAAISDEEIKAARDHYRLQFKDGEFADPSVLAQKYEEYDEAEENAIAEIRAAEEAEEAAEEAIRLAANIIQSEQYHTPYNRSEDIPQSVKTVLVTDAKVISNIFVNNTSDEEDESVYDVEAESAKKRESQPYIVEFDEFYPNEESREVSTLTWYEKDGIMVDENMRALTNGEFRSIIGGEHNLRFGYGSNDPNIVLIYNDKLNNSAFEVVRDPGSYASEVLGVSDSVLEHADARPKGLRKMRPDN